MLKPMLVLLALALMVLIIEFIALPFLEDSMGRLSIRQIRWKTYLNILLSVIIYVVIV